MTATMRERVAIRRTSAVGDEYAAEFASIAEQVLYTCAELGKFMAARGLNVGPLADAQNHAHASLTALRRVAEHLDPDTDRLKLIPVEPEVAEPIADRLQANAHDVRAALTEAADLPNIGQVHVLEGAHRISQAIEHFARLARLHERNE